MRFVEKCPHCNGKVVEKQVQEILSGGNDTAFLNVVVGVCLHCGERLYTPETIRQFEGIEAKLARKKITDFRPLGKSYQVVS